MKASCGPQHKWEEEEPWTSLVNDQLSMEDTDVIRFSVPAVPLKSEEDEENPTTSPGLKTHKDSFSSSETEVSGDDKEVDDLNISEMNDSDSVSETEYSIKGWKESRDPKSGVKIVHKSLSCSECGKRYVNNRSLQKHMTCHSEISSSNCLGNRKSVRVKKTLESCKKVQARPKTISCNACGNKFTCKTQLNRHRRVHTGDKPFPCDLCGQRFSLKAHLNTHRRVHTGDKPFPCDLCGQRFSQKTSLNTHMRVHTGDKPFPCDLCGQRFSLKAHLNTHRRVHTGDKPFPCDLCGQRFSQKTNLNRHRRVHTGERKKKTAIL